MSAERPPEVSPDWAPHDGQREVLESNHRFRIVACGRRWGKTETAAAEAFRRLGESEVLVWWVGPTYDISDIGFEAVEEMLMGASIASKKLTKPKSITLNNGSRISFRSSDREDSLRGEGLDLLILDEAAMIPERAWSNELRPSLSDTLGDMLAISTPKSRNWFYRWFERGNSDDHPDVMSWQSATYENPYVPDEEIDTARREQSERVFSIEYLAEFCDESGGVFSELDDRLFTVDYELPVSPADAEPPFATGVDFARHQDHRVIVTLDATGQLVFYDRDQHEAWPQIQRAVEDAADTYDGIVAVDASRDNKIVADLETAGVTVEPVTFSPQRKTELIEDLIASIESGELSSPEIPQLRHELEVFEYDVTAAGNVRYHAPSGFHDDVIDALALALAADRMSTPTETIRRRGGTRSPHAH